MESGGLVPEKMNRRKVGIDEFLTYWVQDYLEPHSHHHSKDGELGEQGVDITRVQLVQVDYCLLYMS